MKCEYTPDLFSKLNYDCVPDEYINHPRYRISEDGYLYEEDKKYGKLLEFDERTGRCRFIICNGDIHSMGQIMTKIKAAIVQSNSLAKVVIADKEMTVADAITFKSVIELKKQLIERLERTYKSTLAQIEQSNNQVEDNAIRLAEAELRGDGMTQARLEKERQTIMEPFVERNEFHLVDPLKVERKIEELRKEVEGFETEVDAVLSESNATTFIEI